jgi:hypothetical protein
LYGHCSVLQRTARYSTAYYTAFFGHSTGGRGAQRRIEGGALALRIWCFMVREGCSRVVGAPPNPIGRRRARPCFASTAPTVGSLWYAKGALGWLVLLQTLVEGGALVRALRALLLLSDRHSALAPDVVQRRHAFRLPTSATPTRPLVCRGRWRRMPPTRWVRAICVRFTHSPCSDRRMCCMLWVRVELGGVWLCSLRQPPSSCSGTLARHRVGTVRCHGVLRRTRQLRRAEWQKTRAALEVC